MGCAGDFCVECVEGLEANARGGFSEGKRSDFGKFARADFVNVYFWIRNVILSLNVGS